MIIALNGLKGSGKDTVGAYLVKEYGFERRSFADPLKRSIAALFDIPFEDVDYLKNGDSVRVRVWDNIGEFSLSDMSFRQALQRYGTEAHRDVFGVDFWVNQALPVGGFYAGRKIVVTDCRFQNEADRVKLLGGYVVRVIRPGIEDLQDRHISESEQALVRPDYVIMNDGTTHDLFTHTDAALEWLAGLQESQV